MKEKEIAQKLLEAQATNIKKINDIYKTMYETQTQLINNSNSLNQLDDTVEIIKFINDFLTEFIYDLNDKKNIIIENEINNQESDIDLYRAMYLLGFMYQIANS